MKNWSKPELEVLEIMETQAEVCNGTEPDSDCWVDQHLYYWFGIGKEAVVSSGDLAK